MKPGVSATVQQLNPTFQPVVIGIINETGRTRLNRFPCRCSRVSTSCSRNKSSFVGGYLRHGERFAPWFTGQSWWTRSRTMSGDRTREREKDRGGEGKKTRGRSRWQERERAREGRRRRIDLLLGSGRGGRKRGTTGNRGARGKENVVLCSSRCRSSSPGSFLRRGQRPTKPRSRLHSRSDCV